MSTVPEIEQRSSVYTQLCSKERNGPASPNQGVSTASQDNHHVHGMSRPPPPIQPSLPVQNLSSKRIAPIDSMQPKLHDEYTRHDKHAHHQCLQWLKELNFVRYTLVNLPNNHSCDLELKIGLPKVNWHSGNMVS